MPCDNLPGNGAVVGRVLHDLAEQVDPGLAAWIEESVSTVTTVVDRITPRPTPDDVRAVTEATGWSDRAPVVTEPFSEWVLSGAFPRGRPRWEDAGATFTDEIAPFEQRKLWLLNGAHSLLAYAGSARGHTTVADAVADDTCRDWLEQWWDEASLHLDLGAGEVAAYRAALVDRFANPRIRHRLDQIAADGSQKLPVRILPVLRRERAAGRVPARRDPRARRPGCATCEASERPSTTPSPPSSSPSPQARCPTPSDASSSCSTRPSLPMARSWRPSSPTPSEPAASVRPATRDTLM